MSSPMMTRMLGCLPDDAGCWACATETGAVHPRADAAASVVVASRILRRLTSSFLSLWLALMMLLPVLLERRSEIRCGWAGWRSGGRGGPAAGGRGDTAA